MKPEQSKSEHSKLGQIKLGHPKPKRRAPSLVAQALGCCPVGLILLDRALLIRMLTAPAAALLGLAPAPRAGTRLGPALARSAELGGEAIQSILDGLRHADTQPAQLLLSAGPAEQPRSLSIDIRPAGAQGFVLTIADVTASRQTEDWLLEHVSSDAITGLWNRQHFMLMLHDRLTSGEWLGHALLLIALSGFRQVNAKLGTAAGDTLLGLVADRLSAVLHEHDIVARFLGDEFAVAGPVEDLAVTRQFGEKLVEVLCAPYMLEGQLVSLGVHIGAACAPLHGSAAEALAANAALALGEARTARSSLCIFDPAMVERATLRRALEIDLRQALQNQEFELFYQPQVDVHRNCVTGMEGLIRWRSPSRGLVPPIQFIPVAEQMGLICDIGAWVLRAACLEARHWPEAVTVAVNASPLQFESGDFAAQVERALAESGLSPHRLEIEITENLLLRDTGTVVATLDALHRLGVRLVLDDFGTGYASLSQLSRFNFDKIKIDRSFISPDEASTQNSAIVRSIAALGHSLGIPTTAEGVETARQLEQIKADGCTSVQGYFYSRPVPACEVDTLMERLHRPREQQAAA